MAFAGGDTDKLKFVLTQLGQKTLATKGLEKQIFYYTLYDQEVNYMVNVIPNLMVDISGSKNSIVPDSITFRDNLK
jgi:hypothetical protein